VEPNLTQPRSRVGRHPALRGVLIEPNRLHTAIQHIAMMTITPFCAYKEEWKSNKKVQCDDPENPNLAVLHDELDPLFQEFFIKFLKTHKLLEVISRLKSQLLNVNGQLALVHGTQLNPRA